ncbi:MAG: site-specific integrase [Proteobacteria bacterium]|nr:site-specific integrase [Pseudomonadota bacterium]
MRRSEGEGAGGIYRRGGSWYVDAYVGGQRVRRSAGATKVEARRLLERLRQQEARGSEYAALGDILKGYIKTLRLRAKPSTVAQSEVQAGTLERHFGSTFAASSMSPGDLEGFISARLEKVRPTALNGTLRVLRAALRHAVEHSRLPQMPCKVRMLREPKRLPRILAPDQVSRVIERARPPFDIVIAVAAYAGLRHGEILHLCVRDVDLDGRELHVSAKPDVGWLPKSHAERRVPIAGELARLFERQLATLPDRTPTTWVFPGYEGTPYRSAAEPVRNAFKAAGLYHPDAKPGLHQLRRTWASTLLGNGADVETVRELGGWADLATVQRYLASSDDRKRRAIDGLGYRSG